MKTPFPYVGAGWVRLANLFCKATHLSNWWFARILVAIFVVLGVSSTALYHEVWGLKLFSLACMSLIASLAVVRIEKRRREAGDSTDTDTVTLTPLMFLCYMQGCLLTGIGVFFLLFDVFGSPFGVMADVAFITLGGAYYVAIISIPKRPSRTMATIRNISESLKSMPSLVPIPLPS